MIEPVLVLTTAFVLAMVFVQERLAPRVALERDQLQTLLFDKGEQWVVPRPRSLPHRSQ